MPWDLAAAVLFVTEAGGTVTDREGRPFRLDGGEVVASNGHVHQALLLALAHGSALPMVVSPR